jgi:hypothetical protein
MGQYVEIPNGREFAESRAHIRSLLKAESLVVAERIYGIPDSPEAQAPDLSVFLH